MAKINTPRGKLVRKFGENIFGNPKYDRLLNRKPYGPGQHAQTRRGKISNYGTQLQEKQKIKFMYGLLEKQFRICLLYTSPSPRDISGSRMPSSA